MSLIIPNDAYGDRTDALQEIARRAEALRPFAASPGVAAEGTLANELREHLMRLAIFRSNVPRLEKVEILRGPASVIAACWTSIGEAWRDELGRTIGEMHKRYSEKPFATRLGPPIWPVTGTVNIVGPTFVATEATHRICRAVSRTEREFETCWSVACFVEKVVDAALLCDLFSAAPVTANPFTPLLSIYASSFIPIGWSAGAFVAYAFENGLP